jgi:hypothetical protein
MISPRMSGFPIDSNFAAVLTLTCQRPHPFRLVADRNPADLYRQAELACAAKRSREETK